MPFDFSQIPMSKFDDSPCGYFPDRKNSTVGIFSHWIMDDCGSDFPIKTLFNTFLEYGLRRYSSLFYDQVCKNCKECIPIRIPVRNFSPSKSQKTVWRKNQDLEMRFCKMDDSWFAADPRTYFDFSTTTEGVLQDLDSEERPSCIKNFITDEKVLMFRKYSAHTHNEKLSFDEAKDQLLKMHVGYPGVFDMEYYFGERLVAVGIIDAAENDNGEPCALSSNYFYYDVSEPFLKRSLGVFSVLKEIELCRQLGCEFYYLGLYLPSCRKMNYKNKFKPYQLFIDGKWIDGENALGGVAERPQQSEDLQQAPDGDDRSRNAQIKKINTEMIYEIPLPPKDDEFNNDICLVTKDIPLQLLYSAYMQGIFPWFDEDNQQPVMWFCPDPRFVIFPETMHVSKSIKKFLKHTPYTYTMDKAFEQVMKECRKMKRADQNGTWIGEKMIAAYTQFHKEGFAHSFEVWHENRLVGGFYGVLIGSVFCGESMFTIEPDSSKSAFVLFEKAFEACGGKLIDCQCYTDNMARYGAVEIAREDFLNLEKMLLLMPLKADLKKTFMEIVENVTNNQNKESSHKENSYL